MKKKQNQLSVKILKERDASEYFDIKFDVLGLSELNQVSKISNTQKKQLTTESLKNAQLCIDKLHSIMKELNINKGSVYRIATCKGGANTHQWAYKDSHNNEKILYEAYMNDEIASYIDSCIL